MALPSAALGEGLWEGRPLTKNRLYVAYGPNLLRIPRKAPVRFGNFSASTADNRQTTRMWRERIFLSTIAVPRPPSPIIDTPEVDLRDA